MILLLKEAWYLNLDNFSERSLDGLTVRDHMKKSQKGLTLVEVIVSIAVLTIISLALFSSFLGMRRVTLRQEEYVRLEMVCYDLKYEWDMYGQTESSRIKDNDGLIMLNSDFKYTDSSDDCRYKIQYEVTNGTLIIKRVSYLDDSKTFIKDLNCGTSRYGGEG